MKEYAAGVMVVFIAIFIGTFALLTPNQLIPKVLADGNDLFASTNLLENPGFERGLEGWRRNWVDRGAVHEIDNTTSYGGETSLRFSGDRSTDAGVIVQTLAVEGGELYRVAFARRLEKVSSGSSLASSIRIQFMDRDNQTTRGHLTIEAKTGSRDWEWHEEIVEIPINTVKVHFEIWMREATGTVWWDDLYFGPAQSSNGKGGPHNCAPCDQSPNLIPNDSFEQTNDRGLPVGFNTFIPAGSNQSTVEIIADEVRFRTGERSVRIYGEGARAALAHPIAVKGGEAYRLEVWYRKDQEVHREEVLMRVMAYNAKPHNQSNKVPWQMEWVHDPNESMYDVSGENFMVRPLHTGAGLDDWAKLSATFTLPEDIVGLDIHLFNSHGDGAIWFDDISLVRLHPANRKPLPDPSVAVTMLDTLRQGHPRLLAHESDFERIKTTIEEDPLMRQWYAGLSVAADRILLEAPAHYELPDGKRLLSTSRKVLERVETLAMKYRLDQDERHLERVWRELESAADFPDWNPPHFLDTAEMTRAFAIAYDWLYDQWSEEQKQLIRDAILQKGLEPALLYYRGQKPAGWQWSPSWVQNWNFVVNGGITIGALGIAEEEPEVAEEIVREAMKSVKLAVGLFGPDGAWDEGVGYWHYSIRFLIPYFIALETALGSDFGLADTPGISEAGFYPIYLTGPKNQVFNFADSGVGVPRAPEMFWLAERFQQPAFAGWHRQIGDSWGSLTNNLLWYKKGLGDDFEFTELPLDKYFRGVEIATYRNAWEDQDGVFVAFKGGAANVNHGHLDLGDFVLDALGERWAEETGGDNYNLEGYNNRGSGQRWMYYRTRAEGQNTLVINPSSAPDQDVRAFAPMIHQYSMPEEAGGIVDLSSAYPSVTRAWRGVALFDDRRQVIIQDEISAREPAELWWFMHTKANIDVGEDGKTAVLKKGGKELLARILSPTQAAFEVMDAKPLPTSPNPEGQNANIGMKKLAIHLDDVKDLTLVVQFVPLDQSQIAPVLPDVVPLAEWMTFAASEERIWPSFPRMTLDMSSPVASDKVFGKIPLKIHMDVPEDIKVEEVEVSIGSEIVYEGIRLPKEVVVDTGAYDDGLHALNVNVILENGNISSRKFPLRVENWWQLTDTFEPPHTSGWFGTLDRSRTHSTSDGWGYSTDHRDDFFRDATRRVRTSQSTEYLMWSSPDLHSFNLSLYTPTEHIKETLVVEVSPDMETWSEYPYEISVKDRSSNGRYWLEASGEMTGESASWIRVTLREGELPYEEVQLGEMELRGRNTK